MAANPSGKGSYSDCRSKNLMPGPHFFKVVLFPPDQGLRIPGAFMRRYGRDLEQIVFLKVPTGASLWKVELVHYGDGNSLLQKGWEEFAKFYSIKQFHFLVFGYQGNSQFRVLIFDPSALEIEYPVENNCDWRRSDSSVQTLAQNGGSSSSLQTVLEVSDDQVEDFKEISADILKKNYRTTRSSKGKRARVDDVSTEILDDLPQRRPKTRSSDKLMVTENPRKNAAKADTQPCYHTKSSSKGKNQDKNSGKSSVGTVNMPLGSSTFISNYKPVVDKGKFKSYEKAKAFTSSKPFFICFIRPSHVCRRSFVEIPIKFMKEFLSVKKKRQTFTLHVSRRATSWPINIILQTRLPGNRGKIIGGWRKFVQDNGIRVGDVCVFELVPETRKFNITIYSSAEDEIEENDASNEILDDLSQCRVKTRSSHKLVRTENPRKNAVETDTDPGYHTKSSGNEKAKQKQNEKMNKGKRCVGTKMLSLSSPSISNHKTVIDKKKFKSYEKAKAFTSSKPFFITFMQPSYVFRNFYLVIPRSFVMEYLSLKKKRHHFVLHLSGRTISWPVTVVLGRCGFHGVKGMITTGWKKFVGDNGIRVGDVCVFELVPSTRKFNITVYSSA